MRTVALLIALAPVLPAQSTWYVDINATPPGDGSAGSPYTSIQYAINQANTLPGDTLSIAPGTYVGHLQFGGKALRLEGEQGRDVTIIEGGATIDGGMAFATEIEGLTFRYGQVVVESSTLRYTLSALAQTEGMLALDGGELLFIDSHFRENSDGGIGSPYIGSALWQLGGTLTVQDCLFENNRCLFASALNVLGVQISISGSTFRDNWSGHLDYGTGAVSGSSGGLISDCTFIGNTANVGGALAELQCEVRGCLFEENLGNWEGGAIYNLSGPISNCIFRRNEAGRGGAISHGNVEDSIFIENQARWVFKLSGGFGGAVIHTDARRCVFVGNRVDPQYGEPFGGAACFSELANCLLIDNTGVFGAGPAVEVSSLTNSIVIGGPGPRVRSSTVSYSLVAEGHPGVGNIDGDPLLVDLDAGDYRLWPGSPCIDAGDPTMFDPDGTRSDMGPFPFVPVAYCTAKVNSAGCLPAIASTGSPRLTGPDDFYITASNVIPAEWGILAWAGDQGNQPFFGGTLCLQAPIVRTPPTLAIGSGPCGGELSFHFSQAYMSNQLLLAYDTLFAQWWSRDPGLNPPVGLTDGLAVEVLP